MQKWGNKYRITLTLSKEADEYLTDLRNCGGLSKSQLVDNILLKHKNRDQHAELRAERRSLARRIYSIDQELKALEECNGTDKVSEEGSSGRVV